MPRSRNFLVYFLLDVGPSWQLVVAFLLGLLVIGVASNLTFTLLLAPESVWNFGIWRPLAFILVGTASAYIFYRWDSRKPKRSYEPEFKEGPPPPYPGLIWLLGPGKFEHLLLALDHHVSKGGGAHCWLIMQDANPILRSTYADVVKSVAEKYPKTQLHPIYLPELDVKSAYTAVRSVFTREAIEVGLSPKDVIGDITGAVKPLTAGMVLASLLVDGALEYITSKHDDQGNVLRDTATVVQVDVSFYPSKSADSATDGQAVM